LGFFEPRDWITTAKQIMTTQNVWQHMDVPLPALKYQNVTASGQGKGTTEWAAHSHNPIRLELWDDFDALVTAEGQNPRNHRALDLDLRQQFSSVSRFIGAVSREEDVTNRLETMLSVFLMTSGVFREASAFLNRIYRSLESPTSLFKRKTTPVLVLEIYLNTDLLRLEIELECAETTRSSSSRCTECRSKRNHVGSSPF
jgi:hypothetical protein